MFGCLARKELKSLQIGEKESAQVTETTNTEHEISQELETRAEENIEEQTEFIPNTKIQPQPEKEQERDYCMNCAVLTKYCYMDSYVYTRAHMPIKI